MLSCWLPPAALLSFYVCQQGGMPVWWCLIPWESPEAVSGAVDGYVPLGMCWDCWCLIFLLGFVFPSCPLGGSPESVSAGPHRWAPVLGSASSPPQRQRMDAGAVVWGMGAVCRDCSGRHWGLCLSLCSLTPLPPLSVLLFCLNSADAFLLRGLLASFQAFGFGVYCFFFLPTLHKQTQPLAASPMPVLRVC